MHEDQPEPDTFWFKCPRGHVDEHSAPPEGAPPLLCWATVVRSHDGGHGIYTDACREELRRVGPTVAEWRAAHHALADAEVERIAERERLEGMLAEADRALAECGRQLDHAVSMREADSRTASEALDQRDALQTVLDDVLRRQRFAEGMTRAAELHADDEEEEPDRADLAAELARRLAQMERDRDAAEARIEEWRVKAGTEQAGRLAAERKASRGLGFTLVRDVNEQTEEALRKCERSRADELVRRCDAQRVAAWAVSALTKVEHDYPQAHAVYERALDAEAEADR